MGPQCYACDLEHPVEHNDDQPRFVPQKVREEIMARRAEGARIVDLAREYALPVSTTKGIINGKSPKRGIDPAIRERIRAEYVPGLISQAHLAAKYCIAESSVWAILHETDSRDSAA